MFFLIFCPKKSLDDPYILLEAPWFEPPCTRLQPSSIEQTPIISTGSWGELTDSDMRKPLESLEAPATLDTIRFVKNTNIINWVVQTRCHHTSSMSLCFSSLSVSSFCWRLRAFISSMACFFSRSFSWNQQKREIKMSVWWLDQSITACEVSIVKSQEVNRVQPAEQNARVCVRVTHRIRQALCFQSLLFKSLL